MSAIVARYDRHARLYERHWAPVIGPTALRVLDVADAWLPGSGTGATILDLGAGTGTLSRAAARRWPGANVIALDPSAEMLALAAARLQRDGLRPVRVEVGAAEAIPLPTDSVDLIVSSFALQLVPDRPAALRESHRILRPGGHLAYVTWLDRGDAFRPHDAFDEAVLDLGVDEPDEPEEICAGDLRSPGAAAAQLRRAGFEAVGARTLLLRHDWSLEAYLAFKLEYDEWALMQSLSRADRARLERFARRRLSELSADAFVWRAEVVLAWAAVPGGLRGSSRSRIGSPSGHRSSGAAVRSRAR